MSSDGTRPNDVDWSVATFEGNRLRELQRFRTLSFREKMKEVEGLGEVASHLARRRVANGLPVYGPHGVLRDTQEDGGLCDVG